MSEVEFRDTAREDAASRALVYDQVKTLYDYTKFHIGLYLTLGTVLAAALSAKESPVHLWHPAIWAAVGFIALAGMAGGIVASTLPGCRSLREFHEKPIGPWELKLFTGKTWTRIEHTSFWLGIIAGVISIAVIYH
jgi:hypothetical protein